MLRATRFGALVLGSLSVAGIGAAQQLECTPFHTNGIYRVGEPVGWTVTLPAGAATPAGLSYVVRQNNADVIQRGPLNLASGSAKIETALKQPGMIYVEIDADPGPGSSSASGAQPANRIASLGAAVDPSRIQPSVSAPPDFWEFWNAQLAKLRSIPMEPVLTALPTQKEGVDLYSVKLASVGSAVQGYLSKPKREGKFPALVIYQYAGVYKLQPNTVTARAADGWLAFDVDSHDIPPDSDAGVSRDYQAIGNNDREASYFLNMYLRDSRAIDYIRSRPDWDGRTIVLLGTSRAVSKVS